MSALGIHGRIGALVKTGTFVGVGVLLLCAPGIATAQAPSSATMDPVAGERLFSTRRCIECHAADVARFQRQARPLYSLAAAMWNHFPQMADRMRASTVANTPYFTSGEMSDLAAFLYAGDPVSAQGYVGDPTRGQQLVTDKGCLVCHSMSGAGGARAGRLDGLKGLDSPWSVVAQMWNHAFLMQLETQAQRGSWTRLSAGEMADLVAFLQALMRAR